MLVRLDQYPEQFRGVFRTDIVARSLYAEGAGIARAMPSAVAVPADDADVSALVTWARATGHSLIPRGSGSGMAAGALGPHVVLDLSRLRRIHGIDTSARIARADVGVTRAELDAAANAHGLRFPVDPSSGVFCTIGGMTATNAAGARSLRFGTTRPWVQGVRCVFDDGSIEWIRRGVIPSREVPAIARIIDTLAQVAAHADLQRLVHVGVRKESSGYAIATSLAHGTDLVDLLVGSEGTLALFLEVEIALIPVVTSTATVLATFSSLEAATACAVEAAAADANACELLDRTFLDIAKQGGTPGVPDAEALLIIEVEGDDDALAAARMSRIAELCRTHGATELHTALTADDEHGLWSLRHAASPIMSRLPATTRSMQFIEDGCVPPARFPEYVRGVRAALDRASIPGVIFGHAGDAHAHVNPLVNVTRQGWRDDMRSVFDEVCNLTAQLGGTLSGEHGDGRLRAPALPRVWPDEARAAFANIKAAADPALVFNAGCKLASPDADPFESIRQDPLAQPLDPRVRAALDAVERDRAWNRFRLDMVPDESTRDDGPFDRSS